MSAMCTRFHALAVLLASAAAAPAWAIDAPPLPTSVILAPGESRQWSPGNVSGGQTYLLLASISSEAPPEERVNLALSAGGKELLRKALHAGDPDLTTHVRPAAGGPAVLSLTSLGRAPMKLHLQWQPLALPEADRAAIEAEPNDDWRQANPLTLGRDVHGTADDVDYLHNPQEGKSGLDWFRFDVSQERPVLVYFQLDLLDRDVSANLRVHTVDPATGRAAPYLAGKDPMEIVHDRERERYSKHISRTFTKGTYYLEVNANHPDYILRTRVLPVPPHDDPAQAVEAGMHYIMNVGDAWFAQVPREGNIFSRSDNLHDTAIRCTACHASSFSTEANLTGHRNGYPIRSRSNFQYVMDRIANSITPLYGPDGLNWQRFISIPLQAQGKQGGILADYEREVTGRPSPMVERFGPFLKAAWQERTNLPADEQNGVVPLDSKFGLAWRDWRVLAEVARRTGRDDYRRVAEHLASILGERTADRQMETLQDRIHRLHAWCLIDRGKFANKIRRETGALLALQNPDGGWYESDGRSGPSAVYTTGQLVYTLMEAGLARDDPAIARALRYLLSQQQDFGGWFQTTTHENFRTPMRETRYAVMALARAYPRPGAPRTSWGNRDEQPARLPRADSLVHRLDDLENLWDVPASERPRYAAAILPLLDDPSPFVRAAAAACLGRLGHPSAAGPLSRSLGDSSKIVWRSAAWALRRLGNEGLGLQEINAALQDPEPRVRRGAARIFAYQFHGMDQRPELAGKLLTLMSDLDLWTRLQAARSLRQWFYRSGDRDLQRRIVETFLARMAEPDLPVVRRNLSQGLYIMLDENLGGGVSLQKNLEALPAVLRSRVLEARKDLEREVLLLPVLAALERGNAAQRTAVLEAFDGSFFKGRSYARQPEAMIDVGNDREFGFLFQPELSRLEQTFNALLTAPLSDESRRQAILLCSFFRVPERTAEGTIQARLLDALGDQVAGVREAARAAVGRELGLQGAERDARVLEALRRALARAERAHDTAAVLSAIARSTPLREHPEIRGAIRGLLPRADAAALLLPLLSGPEFDDAERLGVLTGGWSRLNPAQRGAALEVLFSRTSLLDRKDPPEQALELLSTAAADPAASVRERTFSGLARLSEFWAGRPASRVLLIALADDTPATRRLGLTLSATKASFWDRPDALEHLARLLIDPDAEVRSQALELTRHHRLVARNPALARRVRALASDPALAARAQAVLRAAGIDPASVQADAALGRPRLPGLASFRRAVNPLFYQTGEDGHSCSSCHANHTILRIAEANPAAGFSAEQLTVNYNSALKVVNLGDPESSLILRKPRSPQGAGLPDPASPTGLTHVGGPRWESGEHPAYRAILAWIRDASASVQEHPPSFSLSADSHAPGHEPARAGDGDLGTLWQTEFLGATPGYPHELSIDLGSPRRVEGLLYVPRQDGSNGRVRDYEVRVSTDGKTWSSPLARGSWPDDSAFKLVPLPSPIARFVQLRGLNEVNGLPVMSAVEVTVESSPSP